MELVIEEIHVMSRAEVPPFDVESASRSAKELEEVRHIRRHSFSQAIIRQMPFCFIFVRNHSRGTHV